MYHIHICEVEASLLLPGRDMIVGLVGDGGSITSFSLDFLLESELRGRLCDKTIRLVEMGSPSPIACLQPAWQLELLCFSP